MNIFAILFIVISLALFARGFESLPTWYGWAAAAITIATVVQWMRGKLSTMEASVLPFGPMFPVFIALLIGLNDRSLFNMGTVIISDGSSDAVAQMLPTWILVFTVVIFGSIVVFASWRESFPKLLCALNLHQWGNWGPLSDPADPSIIENGDQVRYCRGCGMSETKFGWKPIPGATGPNNGYGPTVTIEDLEHDPKLAGQYRALKWPSQKPTEE